MMPNTNKLPNTSSEHVTLRAMLKQEALTADSALSAKEFEKAADIYRRLLKVDPDCAGFWANLGVSLRNSGYRIAALSCVTRALELEPHNLNHLVNMGLCYLDLDKAEEALEALSRAAQQEPDNFIYRRNYAAALLQCNELEAALKQSNIARKIVPEDVEAGWQCAIAHLMLGRLTEGWKDYELRWERGNLKRINCKPPQWTGESLAGKTILLHAEQGLGDTILASRYIPLVKQRGARVILSCRSILHKLFSTIPGIDRMPLDGPLGEPFNYHAPLMSLPGIFGTELNTIPPAVSLSPANDIPPPVAAMLASGGSRFKVGIIWSGNPSFKDNYKRAVPLSRFLPLAAIPGVQLYSLQKGAPEKELTNMGAESLIPELGPHLNDFAETAAVLKKLDLVIMTDSSVAHLAGSLGCPVWNLLHFHPYWLYLTDRANSPWYPSMRLFRQPAPRDWNSVFRDVAEQLEKAVTLKKIKKCVEAV